jgi:hypothetical protein
VALTGNVQTNASATGGGGSGSVGSAPGTAFARSDAKNASGEALTTASSPGGGVGTEAGVGSVSLDPADIGAGRAVSNAILTPNGLDVGVGAMSGAYGGSSGALEYSATALFEFSPSANEALDLNWLSDSSSGIGFDSLILQVTSNGTTQTYKFASLTGSEGAEAFFAKYPLPLGKILAGVQSSVSL